MSFMKTRLQKWVWESGPKIDPATGVKILNWNGISEFQIGGRAIRLGGLWKEGTRTPFRDYVGGHNNCVPRRFKMSTIDDNRDILWKFVFGSRTPTIYALSHHALGAHTPTSQFTTISRFLYNFFGLSIFFFTNQYRDSLLETAWQTNKQIDKQTNKARAILPQGDPSWAQ